MKTKLITILTLLTIASQGAWADDVLTINNSSDNSSAISAANGQTCDVTLQDRTIYRDGDWNTLCLPFDLSADQIAASPLAGFTIMQLTNSTWSNNTKLYLTFSDATTIEAGKPYIVKWPVFVINNKTDWTKFVEHVSNYKGYIVRLNTDIEISTGDIVGQHTATAEGLFTGIFDGAGHIIKYDINSSNSDYANGYAPFLNIQNATIMNLKVTGTVTGGNHSAGLVGYAFGTNLITNCEVASTINCNGNHCGGVLGNCDSQSTTTISNCLFSGTINGNGTNTDAGIIFGWGNNGAKQYMDHCLANGTYNGVNLANGTYNGVNPIDMILGQGTSNVQNCYKNFNSGTVGTYAETITSTICESLGASWTWTTENQVQLLTNATCDDLTNPVFTGVTIKSTNPASTDIQFNQHSDEQRVRFTGTYDNISFSEDVYNTLFLGTSNTLYYPKSGATISACRAYFKIGDDNAASAPRTISFNLNFGDGEATAIERVVEVNGVDDDCWYSLDGRRLNGIPAQRGIYINNGKKILIK